MKKKLKVPKWLVTAAKIFVVLLAAFVLYMYGSLIVTAATAESEANGRCWILCNPDSFVCIRTGPSKKKLAIGGVTCGTMLMTDSTEKKGYLHVLDLAAEDDKGWVSNHYVVYDEPAEVMREGTIRSDGRVAVRKWVDGKTVKWLQNGSRIFVLWKSDTWSVTNCGYVRSEYIEIDTAEEE